MRHFMREGRTGSEATSENVTYHEQYARVNNIVECKEIIMTYYQDYAGKCVTNFVCVSLN